MMPSFWKGAIWQPIEASVRLRSTGGGIGAGAYLTVETSQACGALTSARAMPALKSARRLTAKPRGLGIEGADAEGNGDERMMR
jgi:hypothetical protein